MSIFLSYSQDDLVLAELIVRYIEDAGVSMWYGKRDKAAEDSGFAIATALMQADAVALLFTASAEDSEQIAQELNFAATQKKKLFWIQADDSQSLRYSHFLASAQYIDWRNREDASLDDIVNALEDSNNYNKSDIDTLLDTLKKITANETMPVTNKNNQSPDELYSEAEVYYEEKDYAKAAELYRQASEQGHVNAQHKLGLCYLGGKGVKQDDLIAVEYFRKAAEQGNAESQTDLADCYVLGMGVEQDNFKAAEWYRRAAEQGNPKAQSNLAECYACRLGVEYDRSKATEWYFKAAEQGDPEAQYSLACYYHDGIEEWDDAKYFQWLQKAAIQGHPEAQFGLGTCYESGIGVEKNYSKAIELYFESANQGCELGIEELQRKGLL